MTHCSHNQTRTFVEGSLCLNGNLIACIDSTVVVKETVVNDISLVEPRITLKRSILECHVKFCLPPVYQIGLGRWTDRLQP